MNVANLQQTTALNRAALSIAGSDSSGGAGLQADLKTFSAFSVFGATAVTAVTAQNTVGVRSVETLSARLVADQIAACLADLPIRAAKTGMLASTELIEAVAGAWPEDDAPALVVDPVMVATSGARLLDESAEEALVRHLLPRATLITPNRPEAAVLAQLTDAGDVPAEELAARILDRGAQAVLIKDGHNRAAECRDVLVTADGEVAEFRHERLPGRFHGTGCALSAAICALLARGESREDAVRQAGNWLARQIAAARMPLAGDLALLPFETPW